MERVDSWDTGSNGLSTINILLLFGTEKNQVNWSKYSFPAESWKANVLDLILNCIVYRPCTIGASEAVCFQTVHYRRK